MKITTLKKYKTKLLKLKLLNTKTHKNQKNFNYLLLKNIENRLKKILNIVYKFHIANKKILFIGTPLKLNNKITQIFKNKKHNFIPQFIWTNGIITNSKPSFKYLIKQYTINKNKTSKFLFNFKNQADLIVILNEYSNLTILKEGFSKRIPVILLNANYNFFSSDLSIYKTTGNYSFTKKTIRNNIFFLLISAIFKKAEKWKNNNLFIRKQNAFKKK